MIFGGGDLASDLGCTMAWEAFLYARSRVVQTTAMAKIPPLDVPYLKLNKEDLPDLTEETLKSKELGFKGKLAIHPMHISIVQDLFYPNPGEIKYAEKVISAFKEANQEVCIVDVQIIDYALIEN